MNTIEGNKLIAEFMGLNSIVENNGVVYKDNNTNEIFELKYHSSWDWLMPVVEKIDKTNMENGDWFMVSIGKFKVSVFRKDKLSNPYFDDEISIDVNDKKITSVWLAVVKFIQWYNGLCKSSCGIINVE